MEQKLKLNSTRKPRGEARPIKVKIQDLLNNAEMLSEQKVFLTQYWDYIQQSGIKERSQETEMGHLITFSKHNQKSFLKLTKKELCDYIRWLRERGNLNTKGPLSEATIKLRITILKAFFTWLKDNMEQEIANSYTKRIDGEPNLELKRKLRNERNELVMEIKTNHELLFPKTLMKEMNLQNRKIDDYDRFDPEQLITVKDVEEMLMVTNWNRNKCFIAMLYESNCRAHELLKLNRADVEEYEGIFFIKIPEDTKSGSRDIELIQSIPYIKTHLNDIDKLPETPLFSCKWRGEVKRLSYQGAKGIIRGAMTKAKIKKPQLLHLFRHSGTTRDKKSGKYTDDDIRMKNGWSKNSNMLQRYSHKSSREEAERRAGIKKEDVAEVMSVKKCSKCSNIGPSSSTYCDCGGLLLSEDRQQKEKDEDFAKKLLFELLKDGRIDREVVKEKAKELMKLNQRTLVRTCLNKV